MLASMTSREVTEWGAYARYLELEREAKKNNDPEGIKRRLADQSPPGRPKDNSVKYDEPIPDSAFN